MPPQDFVSGGGGKITCLAMLNPGRGFEKWLIEILNIVINNKLIMSMNFSDDPSEAVEYFLKVLDYSENIMVLC